MKKYLLVSLTILFAAAFVWAEEATIQEPKIDVEADAKVSWGIDLGKGDKINAQHGFKNEASWTVKFPLIKKGDKVSAKTDVPVYGEVIVKKIELNIQSKHDKFDKKFALDGKVDKLEATLHFYGAYLTVFNAPNFKTNYAQIWKPLESDDDYKEKPNLFKPGFDGMGTKLGYKNKNFMDLDVGLKLGSNGSWDSEDTKSTTEKPYLAQFDGKQKVPDNCTATSVDGLHTYVAGVTPPLGAYVVTETKPGKPAQHSKYGMGVDFSIKPLDKMLELALTVNSTFSNDYGKDSGLNFGAEVKSEPMAGLKLKAGFDGYIGFTKNAKFECDTVFTADYKWIGAGVYFAPRETRTVGRLFNLSAFAKFETKEDKKEASHLVDGLEAGAYVGLYKLLDTSNGLSMLTKVWGSYKIGLNDSSWIKPFAHVWIETAAKEFDLAYDLGVVYSPVEKVEVEAKINHGLTETTNGHGKAIKSSAIGKDHHNGRFVLSLKLIY